MATGKRTQLKRHNSASDMLTSHFDTDEGNQAQLSTTQPFQVVRKKRCKRTSNNTNNAGCDDDLHASSQQLSQLTSESIDIIDSIAGINATIPHSSVDIEIQRLAEQVASLARTVESQARIINELRNKLEIILPIFGASGISEQTVAAPSSTNEVDDQQRKSSDTATSYSNVVKSNRTKVSNAFQQAVISAVQVENQRKAVRQKNVIITGLPAVAETNASQEVDVDADSVLHLLQTELNVRVNVVNCQRLGNQMPGKIRPLRVSLANADDAERILFLAKRLRLSKDEYTSRHIYINKDLTKAEAAAAYEQRCRRRETNKDAGGQRNPTTRTRTFVPSHRDRPQPPLVADGRHQ